MSPNNWKLFVQLKDSLSKVSNDRSIQNVFSKDIFQLFQKVPSSLVSNETTESSKDKTESYILPNVLQTIKTKMTINTDTTKVETPDWKKQQTVSKSSILSRTEHVLSSITTAETDKSLLYRIEALTLHIRQYPESRNSIIRQGAIQMLLLIRNRIIHSEIQDAIREALAVLGYINPVPCQGIRILSIDGGGIRGLLVLEMLKKLEELTGQRTHEMFDFFCGVSTGAILSFSIGVNQRSLDEIIEGYTGISKEVFQQSALWGTSNLVWSHSYYDTSLWQNKLKEHLGDMPLITTSRDPTCPKMCAVSAVVNQSHLSAFVFRNYSLPWFVRSQYGGSSDYAVWEAARASAAAPTYFEEFRLGDFIHQDGGILVNNPTAIALHEAKLLWPNTPVQCVVSFGTGRTVPIASSELKKATSSSNTSWSNKFMKILDSATDTEAPYKIEMSSSVRLLGPIKPISKIDLNLNSVHTMLNDLLPGNVYYRFNPYLTEMIGMVEIREEKLEQMKRDALMYLRRNEDKFQEAAKALTIKKSHTQKVKEWVKLQKDLYLF